MRELRAPGDRPVYASFYYAWIRCPLDRPLSSHQIDDQLGFDTSIRLFGDTLVDGWHRLLSEDELVSGNGPVRARSVAPAVGDLRSRGGSWIRMSNVFVAKKDGPAKLEVCSPVNLDPGRFPRSSRRFETYHKIKRVRSTGRFEAAGGRRETLLGRRLTRIPINPDRDINGVGLVYFANYITFLDTAERELLQGLDVASRTVHRRSLVEREIAYYANARADDSVEVVVVGHRLEARAGDPSDATIVRFDYEAHRCSDHRLLCVSSATKLIPHGRTCGREARSMEEPSAAY